MRTIEDYKKLVKGYNFSLSILKQTNTKAYEHFKKSIELLNNNNCLFAQLVNGLKVDYLNENDDGNGDAYTVKQKNIIKEEFYGMSYSPKDDYRLGLLYMKDTPIGFKKVFYDISPVSIEDFKHNESVEIFGITTLNEKIDMDKSFVYVGKLKEDNIVIYEVDLDNPDVYTRDFKIKLSKVQEAESEVINKF